MRKALIVVAVVLVASSAAWAQEAATAEEGPQYTVFTKFFRGVGNILASPLEIPVSMYNVSADTDVFIGTLAGGAAGVASGAERLKAGCMDVALCLFPPYDRSLITYEIGRSPAAQAAAAIFPGTDEF